MRIDLVRGSEAARLIEQVDFQDDWSRLAEQCPWATVFQDPGFCSTWYRIYRDRFEPLLAICRDACGRLNGLLPLAISALDRRLAVAGAWQAEYQSWISQPDLGESFPWQAIQAIRQEYTHAALTFHYLPPKAPTGWLRCGEAARLCRLEPHRRPLWRFGDGNEIEATLRKRRNRNRLNRLKKMGPMEFRPITDPAEYEAIFDAIAQAYDFRQAALYGSAPFQEDCFKKAFHLALMAVPGLLHVTALTVGDKLASAHIALCGHNEVHACIPAHDPWLAAYSPGTLHLYFLSRLLREQGFEQLDLTPGGDAYKERVANAFDTVHTLTVFASSARRRMQQLREGWEERAKTGLRAIHLPPERIKRLGAKFRKLHAVHTPLSILRTARQRLHDHRELRLYSCEAASARALPRCEAIRRDALQDLLLYRPAERWQSREAFLLSSLEQIASGNHVYTAVRDGCLVHFGWLIERQTKAFLPEVHQEFAFPPDSAVLFDFYTHPEARGRGLYTHSLRTMLCDAANIPGTHKVFIAVLADNGPSRHVIEKSGFAYEGSLFESHVLGFTRQWSNLALQLPAPSDAGLQSPAPSDAE